MFSGLTFNTTVMHSWSKKNIASKISALLEECDITSEGDNWLISKMKSQYPDPPAIIKWDRTTITGYSLR